MALKVWLPLNGNANNYGISDVTITNNGATIDNSGKIGKCYKFDGNNNYIEIDGIDYIFKGGSQPFSISMWVYSQENGTRGILFSSYGNPSTSNFFAFELNSGSVTNNTLRFDWNGVDLGYGGNLAVNGWTHIACTYDGQKVLKYINGVLTQTINGILATIDAVQKFRLGRDNRTGSTAFLGKINDFRVYDHCLSPKEVKEISKGLVLHYALKNGSTGLGNPNLVKNTNTPNINTNTWSQPNAVGGTTRSIYYDDGIPCVQSTRDNVAQSSWSYFCYSSLDTTLLKKSTTYTISYDMWASVSGTVGMNGFMHGNATNQLSTSSTVVQGNVIANQWNHMIFRTTTKSDWTGLSTTGQVVYMSVSSALRGVGVILRMKNLKVEEGTVETPWCPHISDELYTTLEYNQLIEEDLSGYGYNGSINGTYNLSTDSPRYLACADFSKSGHIINSSFNVNGKANTISMWVKQKTATTQHFLFGTFTSWTGNGIGFYRDANQAGYNCIFKSTSESSYGSLGTGIIALNTWTHIAFTYNGSTIICYINGVEKSRKTYGSNGDITNPVFMIANSKFNNTPASENEECYISDVRFYATALSAADILELYEAGGAIDSYYNSYTYEYITDDSNEYLNSQGISGISDLEETDENTKWLSTGKIESNNFYEI